MKISIHDNKNLEITSEVVPIGLSDFSTNILATLVASSLQTNPDCFAMMDLIRKHLQKDIITNCDPVKVVLLEFSQEDLDLYSRCTGAMHIDAHELTARYFPFTHPGLHICRVDFRDRSNPDADSDISYFFRWEFTAVPTVEDIIKPDDIFRNMVNGKCILASAHNQEESLFIPLKYFDEHMEVIHAAVTLWNQRRHYTYDCEIYFDFSECQNSHDRVSVDFYYLPKD